MSTILKTNCTDCIFKVEKCFLKKDVFLEGETQYTEGFCRHKRPFINYNIKQTYNDILNDIIRQENTISIIIVALDNNRDKIFTTIKNIEQYKEFINQIVIATRKAPKELMAEVANYLHNRVGWSINNIIFDEEPSEYEAVDNSTEQVTNHWFLPLISGDTLSVDEINLMITALTLNNNLIAGFFNIDNEFKVLTNIYAFIEMEGHFECPWFRKIKTFSNWSKCCIEIK